MFPLHLLADTDPDQIFPADFAIFWLVAAIAQYLI
jgi:hypothetical protein